MLGGYLFLQRLFLCLYFLHVSFLHDPFVRRNTENWSLIYEVRVLDHLRDFQACLKVEVSRPYHAA